MKILLRHGEVIESDIYVVDGPAMIGDPTALVEHDDREIWVVPSPISHVDFVEHIEEDE